MRFAAVLLLTVSLHAQTPVYEAVVPIYGYAVGELGTQYSTMVFLTNLDALPATASFGDVFPRPGESCTPYPTLTTVTIEPGGTASFHPLNCNGLAALTVRSTRPLIVTVDVSQRAPFIRNPHSVTEGRFALFAARTRVVFPSVAIGAKRDTMWTRANLFFFARTAPGEQFTATITETSDCGKPQKHVVTAAGNQLHSLTFEQKTWFCGSGDVGVIDQRFRVEVEADAPFFAYVSEVGGGHGTFYMPFVPID